MVICGCHGDLQMIESPEVEKEVKRLLRADTFAVNVCIL